MLRKLIGLVAFFALCVYGYHFRENHKSTGYKAEIVILTDKTERLEKKADRLETERDMLEASNKDILRIINAKKNECKELAHPWEDESENEDKDETVLDAGISQ